jgi:hypothetical protein
MPKIRDLAINRIPSADPTNKRDAGGYWMCQRTTVTPPESANCPKPQKPKKSAGSLPDDAVVQLRQQLRNHLHA